MQPEHAQVMLPCAPPWQGSRAYLADQDALHRLISVLLRGRLLPRLSCILCGRSDSNGVGMSSSSLQSSLTSQRAGRQGGKQGWSLEHLPLLLQDMLLQASSSCLLQPMHVVGCLVEEVFQGAFYMLQPAFRRRVQHSPVAEFRSRCRALASH